MSLTPAQLDQFHRDAVEVVVKAMGSQVFIGIG